MGTDIHSYIEARAHSDAPWQLCHELAVSDYDDGRLDVIDGQPFGNTRSSIFFVVLTGIISSRVDVDFARLQPLVPEDRELGPVSDGLAQILAGWGDGVSAGPYWLSLADLERVDWDAPVPMTDDSSMTYEDAAPYARGVVDTLRELARGRSPDDVRIVFFLDW